jgi:hypothetical protein
MTAGLELLATHGDQEIWLAQFQNLDAWNGWPKRVFRLLAIADGPLDDASAGRLFEGAIKAGCCYILSAGRVGAALETAADQTIIRLGLGDAKPHILTTGHAEDGLDEVLWEALYCSSCRDWSEFLPPIVIVAVGPERQAEVRALAKDLQSALRRVEEKD